MAVQEQSSAVVVLVEREQTLEEEEAVINSLQIYFGCERSVFGNFHLTSWNNHGRWSGRHNVRR